jgi:hypothetical protein
MRRCGWAAPRPFPHARRRTFPTGRRVSRIFNAHQQRERDQLFVCMCVEERERRTSFSNVFVRHRKESLIPLVNQRAFQISRTLSIYGAHSRKTAYNLCLARPTTRTDIHQKARAKVSKCESHCAQPNAFTGGVATLTEWPHFNHFFHICTIEWNFETRCFFPEMKTVCFLYNFSFPS